MKIHELFSRGDFIELWQKLREKGLKVFYGRFQYSAARRAESHWDIQLKNPGWWSIPAVKRHWANRIAGHPQIGFAEHIAKNYLGAGKNLLSVGCGAGWLELALARHSDVQIRGIDRATGQIARANAEAVKMGLDKLAYKAMDFFELKAERYDYILFYESLHHFRDMDKVLVHVKTLLKPGGRLIVHEYCGPDRFRWTGPQLKETNRLLKSLPKKYRRKAVTGSLKKRAYRPGSLRMWLSDPSEAPSSSQMRSKLHEHFVPEREVPLGGTILQALFKDIAHHFIKDDEESRQWAEKLIAAEESFIGQAGRSDFIFGVYAAI